MAEVVYNEERGEWEQRQLLRSPYIDYFNGRFFVTFQCYHNKSVFGAIVGDQCVLSELGEAVEAAWRSEPQHVAGLTLGGFVVMPNHFHAIVEYHSAGGDRATAPGRFTRYTRAPDARDLPYVIGLFKSYTTNLYYRLKSAGRCPDIGPHLWQDSFYDELIRNEEQYRNTAHYIRYNPNNWNSDRFGAVTSYAEGNIGLLQGDYVAYLSSEGRVDSSGLPMARYSAARGGAAATSGDQATAARGDAVATGGDRATAPCGDRATAPGRSLAAPSRAIISTFTSYYERQVLARCLANQRRFIWVLPGGFTPAALAQTSDARAAGRALLISPVAPETGVNKQRANWCNQFIAKNASEIWIGHLRPGGSLEAILKTTTTRDFQ